MQDKMIFPITALILALVWGEITHNLAVSAVVMFTLCWIRFASQIPLD